jgi:hypothetical protein
VDSGLALYRKYFEYALDIVQFREYEFLAEI